MAYVLSFLDLCHGYLRYLRNSESGVVPSLLAHSFWKGYEQFENFSKVPIYEGSVSLKSYFAAPGLVQLQNL